MARIPALGERALDILFDKSSWESIPWIPPENIEVLNYAADKWHTYIKLNPVLIEKMRKKFPKWNGIRMSKLKPTVKLPAGIIAKCGPHNLIDYSLNSITFKCPTRFVLSVDSNKYNQLDPQQKKNILVHEFGHALGFGPRILKKTNNEYYINSTNLPLTINAYNNIMLNPDLNWRLQIPNVLQYWQNNTILPIENKEGLATKGYHWDNDRRSFPNLNIPGSALHEEYRGLKKEIMIGFIDPINPVISQISIKALVEGIGYVEKNPGQEEGSGV